MSPSHGPLHSYLEEQLIDHDRESLDASEPPLSDEEQRQYDLEVEFIAATGLSLPTDPTSRRQQLSDWQRLLEEER